MKPFFFSLIFCGLLLFLGCGQSIATKENEPAKNIEEEIEKALMENPDLILKILNNHKVELFEIAQAGAIKKQAEDEKREMDKYFKNPIKPELEDGRPIRGNPDAKITIFDYSDFECPFCAKGAETANQILKKYAGKIRLVLKHHPLDFHKNAMPAAKYFEAIALQSEEKAWEFHDLLFKNQEALKGGIPALEKLAKELGLDIERLKLDINKKSINDRIQRDILEARKFGFSGTPSFLINGIPLKGAYPIENFTAIIEKLLANQG